MDFDAGRHPEYIEQRHIIGWVADALQLLAGKGKGKDESNDDVYLAYDLNGKVRHKLSTDMPAENEGQLKESA